MKSFFLPSVIVRIIAAVFLFWALARHQYGYYIILRWIVCAVSAYCTYIAITTQQNPWAWLFGVIALFFNPFLPVKLNREMWAITDVVIGIIMIVSVFFVREITSAEQKAKKELMEK